MVVSTRTRKDKYGVQAYCILGGSGMGMGIAYLLLHVLSILRAVDLFQNYCSRTHPRSSSNWGSTVDCLEAGKLLGRSYEGLREVTGYGD